MRNTLKNTDWRKVAWFLGTLVLLIWLAACAPLPPKVITIEKPIVIESPPEYVPVPPSLFDGCIPPAPAGPTNGDLLLHDHAEADYAACLGAQIAAVKALR